MQIDESYIAKKRNRFINSISKRKRNKYLQKKRKIEKIYSNRIKNKCKDKKNINLRTILVEDNSSGESEADEVQLVEGGAKGDEKVKLEEKKDNIEEKDDKKENSDEEETKKEIEEEEENEGAENVEEKKRKKKKMKKNIMNQNIVSLNQKKKNIKFM